MPKRQRAKGLALDRLDQTLSTGQRKNLENGLLVSSALSLVEFASFSCKTQLFGPKPVQHVGGNSTFCNA